MSIEVLNESGEAEVNEQMLIDVASFAMRSSFSKPSPFAEFVSISMLSSLSTVIAPPPIKANSLPIKPLASPSIFPTI